MRVKRLLLVLAALAMIMALAACGGGSGDSANAPAEPQQQEQPQQEPQQQAEQPAEPAGGGEQAAPPEDETLQLTVPKMARLKDDTIPTTVGTDEAALKDHAAIHLEGTGFPWEEEANVYIAGHRLGYPNTDSFLAFWDLDVLKNGDKIRLTDANGTEYTYEVFKTFDVAPTDLYVTEPVPGKNIVTLQSCTLPDYSRRLLVQGELVEA